MQAFVLALVQTCPRHLLRPLAVPLQALVKDPVLAESIKAVLTQTLCSEQCIGMQCLCCTSLFRCISIAQVYAFRLVSHACHCRAHTMHLELKCAPCTVVFSKSAYAVRHTLSSEVHVGMACYKHEPYPCNTQYKSLRCSQVPTAYYAIPTRDFHACM